MIRSNLFKLVAGVVFVAAVHVTAQAQHGHYAGHPPLIQMPQSSYVPPIVDHYVQGPPKLWDDQQPIEAFLHEVASRSWIRLEYLNWNYRRPGDDLVGAPVTGLLRVVPNNSLQGIQAPVDINDNLNGGNTVGQTLFPTEHTIGKEDIPGLRGTLGVALNGADLEMSFFGMEQSSDEFLRSNIAGPRDQLAVLDPTIDPSLGTTFNPNYAIPLLTGGAVTDVAAANYLIFNDSLQIEQESQLWGSEIMLLTDKDIPGGEGPAWQWLGGFRYINLDETFNVRGTFDGRGLQPDRSTNIQSLTVNNIYGPQIGARASLNSRWFTLSATPRVTFGVNDHTSTVTANPLGAAVTRTGNESVDFGTVTQLNLMAEIHFNTHFSVYGGYDFIWIPDVTRPDENINWNSTNDLAGGFTPNITEHTNFSSFIAQGISVGAVFRY